jgi:hypothetical protein
MALASHGRWLSALAASSSSIDASMTSASFFTEIHSAPHQRYRIGQ